MAARMQDRQRRDDFRAVGVPAVGVPAVRPLFGVLSDKIGQRQSMICFGVLSTVLAVRVLHHLADAGTEQSRLGAMSCAIRLSRRRARRAWGTRAAIDIKLIGFGCKWAYTGVKSNQNKQSCVYA